MNTSNKVRSCHGRLTIGPLLSVLPTGGLGCINYCFAIFSVFSTGRKLHVGLSPIN